MSDPDDDGTAAGVSARTIIDPSDTDPDNLIDDDWPTVPAIVQRHLMNHEQVAYCVRKHPALIIPAASAAILAIAAAWLINAIAYYRWVVPKPVHGAALILCVIVGLAIARRVGGSLKHFIIAAILIAGTLGVAVTVALNGLTSMGQVVIVWCAAAIVAGWGVFRVASWHAWYFVVTGYRLIDVRGFPRVHVEPMPLRRLADLRYDQSVPGRIFGYGTLECASFATDHALRLVRWLPESDLLEREIWSLTLPAGGGGVLSQRLMSPESETQNG